MSGKGGLEKVREVIALVVGLVCRVLIVKTVLVFCDIED